MSAWGADSFANDDAQDWINDLCDAPSKALIIEALMTVVKTDTNEYLELRESGCAIAAAEIVAALKGVPNASLSNEVKKCISKLRVKADKKTIILALEAVERIKTNSEARELWEESENTCQWYEAMGDLEARLKQ